MTQNYNHDTISRNFKLYFNNIYCTFNNIFILYKFYIKHINHIYIVYYIYLVKQRQNNKSDKDEVSKLYNSDSLYEPWVTPVTIERSEFSRNQQDKFLKRISNTFYSNFQSIINKNNFKKDLPINTNNHLLPEESLSKSNFNYNDNKNFKKGVVMKKLNMISGYKSQSIGFHKLYSKLSGKENYINSI